MYKSSSDTQAKHIDGVYRRRAPHRKPIQVALPLATPAPVSVQWSHAKAAQKKSVRNDKYYAMATAAFTGVRPRHNPVGRLQRPKHSNAFTIARAVKLAHVGQKFQKGAVPQIARLAKSTQLPLPGVGKTALVQPGYPEIPVKNRPARRSFKAAPLARLRTVVRLQWVLVAVLVAIVSYLAYSR